MDATLPPRDCGKNDDGCDIAYRYSGRCAKYPSGNEPDARIGGGSAKL
jgi:hypothetical protein